MESAFVGGVVADEDGELGRVNGIFEGDGALLEMERAVGEPVVLGHVLNEERFGDGCGLVVVEESGEESVEFFLGFVTDEELAGGEACLRLFWLEVDLPASEVGPVECFGAPG